MAAEDVHPVPRDATKLVLAAPPLVKKPCRKWQLTGMEGPYGVWRPEGYQPPTTTADESMTTPTIKERFSEYMYTDEEYIAHIAGTDSAWSREETDYLMKLVLDMNLKWPCIQDAYTWPPPMPRKLGHTTPRDPSLDFLDLADSEDSDTLEDPPAAKRSIEQLKDRFYKICRIVYLARQSANQEMDELAPPLPLPAQLDFDTALETRRKEEAEARYSVNSEITCREKALREAVMKLQNALKSYDRDGEWPAALPVNPFSPDIVPESDGNFIHQHLAAITHSLLPALNLTNVMGKHKGCWLISQALKMPMESMIGSALADPRKQGGRGASSSVSGRPTDSNGPNLKEVADGSLAILKTMLKEWNNDPEEENPRTYFASQSFLPPVNSRQCFEAYVALKVDAVVCYQLQKHKDRTQELYQQWVTKLQELRRVVRSARRGQQRGSTTTANDRWKAPGGTGGGKAAAGASSSAVTPRPR